MSLENKVALVASIKKSLVIVFKVIATIFSVNRNFYSLIETINILTHKN